MKSNRWRSVALVCAVCLLGSVLFAACGEPGEKGADGVGIVAVQKIRSEGLTDLYEIRYSDGESETFRITNGKDGTGILTAEVNEEGELVFELSDGREFNLGSVVGAPGEKGEDGKNGLGIEKAEIFNGYLLLSFTDGTSKSLGKVTGETGAAGPAGQDGADGQTPYVGENGNWWVGNRDTGEWAGGETQDLTGFLEFYPIGGMGPADCSGYSVSAGRAKYLDYVVVPEEYLGKPVVRIEEGGFRNCEMKALYLPDNLEEIGAEAFYGCENLTDLSISPYGKLKTVGDRAFYGCPQIKEVLFDTSTESMGEEVFSASEITKLYFMLPEAPAGWAENWSGGCEVIWGFLVPDENDMIGVSNLIEGVPYDRYRLDAFEVQNILTADLLAECPIECKAAWLEVSDPDVAVMMGEKLVGLNTGTASLVLTVTDGETLYRDTVGEVTVIDERDFYPIDSVEDLQNIQNNLSGNYKLAADLDLSGIEWAPLGRSDIEESFFTGRLINPEGYVIRNLTISSGKDLPSNDIGLFSDVLYAWFEGIRLEDVYIDGRDYENSRTLSEVGCIAGIASMSTFLHCSVTGAAYAQRAAGGITGTDSWGYYEDCSFEGDLYSKIPEGTPSGIDYGVGGIVGIYPRSEDDGVGILNCHVKANLVSDAAASGIAGTRYEWVIGNCTFEGTLDAPRTGEMSARF